MELIEILKTTQEKLKKKLNKELKKLGYETVNEDGFLYAEGTHPVMLCAHMDTVHANNCTIICTSPDGKYLMSPQGIGGDDRCGIYMIMKIIEKTHCSVLFLEDEESGCVGARKFCKTEYKPKNLNYIVEIDRKGHNDAVFYSCDNPEFEKFITQEKYGFKSEHGSCSDISYIAPHLGTAAVNISSGYYNQHTIGEYINVKQVFENIKRISGLINEDAEFFEYIEKKSTYSYYSYKDKGGSVYNYYSGDYDILSDELVTFMDWYGFSENEITRNLYELSSMFRYRCTDGEDTKDIVGDDNYAMDSEKNLYLYDVNTDVYVETGMKVEKTYYKAFESGWEPHFSAAGALKSTAMSKEVYDYYIDFLGIYYDEDYVSYICDNDSGKEEKSDLEKSVLEVYA